MSKNKAIKRSAKTGRWVTGSLGKAKASRFSMVEGLSLDARSTATVQRIENRRLKGDAARKEISGTFSVTKKK